MPLRLSKKSALVFGLVSKIIRFLGAKAGLSHVLESNKILAERESYLTALIASVPGYVCWFDSSARYLGVNEKFARDLGLEPKEVIGRTAGFAGLSSPDFKTEIETFFRGSAKRKETTIFVDHVGERRQFLVCFEKYQNDTSAVVVCIDTTSQWQAELQSAKDRELAVGAARLSSLGEMAGSVAHEINTPLAVIQGGCFRLRKRLAQPGAQYEDQLEMIESMTFRINKIISGLRSFVRDGGSDEFAMVELKVIIDEVVSLCSDKFQGAGIELRLPKEHLGVRVRCRQVQIGQVLVNLLNNGFDAVTSLENRWIEISVAVGQRVEISVTDSGGGIPDDVATKIMRPFFTTKPIGKGTGLGLSISTGIIHEHGGELALDRSCKNTRFVIALPVADEPSKNGIRTA